MARWVGIDITEVAVRVAVVRTAYRRFAVDAMREEPLTAHETPSAALRAAMAGLRAEAAATSIDGRRAFLRLLSLPAAAQKELANVLSFEVEATLPFELDDAVMDHRLLTILPGADAPGMLPILAGVAYTDEVRDRIGLVLRGAGQEPQRVGLGSVPIANLVQIAPELGRDGPVAILELDEEHSDLLVLRRGEPRFARTIARGVRGLPDTATELAQVLRQTVGAWRMQGGEPLETVYVVGSGHATPGLGGFMQRELGIEVRDLPPMSLEGLTPDQKAELPRYAKAIAMALGLSRRAADLNLRQGPLQAQQSYQFLRDKTPLIAGLGAAIFVSFGFSIFAEMRALGAEQESLERQLEIATQTQLGEKTADPKKATQLLEDAISGKTGDPVPRVDAFGVMVELSERLPPADKLTHDIAEFDYNRGQVVIKGIVPTIDDAHAVADKMKEHECFREVNVARTTRLNNQDKQKYTLEFSVECGPAEKKDKPGAKSSSKAPKGGKP
jgi:general secretion pathway protein L